jgi:hypothetical protein
MPVMNRVGTARKLRIEGLNSGCELPFVETLAEGKRVGNYLFEDLIGEHFGYVETQQHETEKESYCHI